MLGFRILIILLNAHFILCENHFMAAVRNLTNNTSNSNANFKHTFNNDNTLKDEVAKYLNGCKSDAANSNIPLEIRYDEGSNGNRESNIQGTERRSSRESGNFDNANIDGYVTNYRNDHTNSRRQNSCTEDRINYNQMPGTDNYQNYHINKNRNANEFDSRDDGNYEGNRNGEYEQGTNYRNRQDYNNRELAYRRSQNHDEFTNYERMDDYRDGGGNGGFVRHRRQSQNLDENSMPSETATIKYLQDHIQNDRKRIKLVRETRRCFAKLATTELDDGCEYSKTLAKCLKLNIE